MPSHKFFQITKYKDFLQPMKIIARNIYTYTQTHTHTQMTSSLMTDYDLISILENLAILNI